MPELPEVEIIARELDKNLRNKKIKSIEVSREKSFQGASHELVGKTIEAISRRAKMTLFRFKKWDSLLLIHLKMTGQLVWRKGTKNVAGGHPSADWVGSLPSKHTRVIINFVDGSKLFFNDLRIFGWLKVMKKVDWQKLEAKLPADVLDDNFTLDFFRQTLLHSGKAIKLVIMDQAKMGGVGNIYANDALLLAKIKPNRPAKSLTEKEMGRLHLALKKILAKGVKYGGASYSNYVAPSGMGGSYQKHFLAYKQAGKVCKLCKKGIIKKVTLGGRGTFFCPNCQK